MNDRKSERRGLGRGLSALMADVNLGTAGRPEQRAVRADTRLPMERIEPKPEQPPSDLAPESPRELRDRSREEGVKEPVNVWEKPYE